jgi:hypothetical protein
MKEGLEDETKVHCYGPNRISYCTMHKNQLVAPCIGLLSLTNPRLQHIFNVELDDLIKSFEDLRHSVDERSFKYEVMLSFWLSIHLEKLAEAQELLLLDPLIQKVVINLRTIGATVLQLKKNKEELRRQRSIFAKKVAM